MAVNCQDCLMLRHLRDSGEGDSLPPGEQGYNKLISLVPGTQDYAKLPSTWPCMWLPRKTWACPRAAGKPLNCFRNRPRGSQPRLPKQFGFFGFYGFYKLIFPIYI
ncbi:hypothetical protein P378_12150 [Desulforamulus profundi]|uniref:Uncharacterized protein n=1 Tax=Desulforamulus profundi TaxID=1383067 RepID=A0A2C6L2B9_9FIRM|nr:hypothetical protein P378_12150 [Desulforamulus profundi]